MGKLNSRQRATLEEIFSRPTRPNIRWSDAEGLLRALGIEVSEGRGSRVRLAEDGPAQATSETRDGPRSSRGSAGVPVASEARAVNTLQYKEYTGVFEYDEEADLLHGRVVGLRDVVTFEGRSVDELRTALADSVEDYLEFCRELGQEPDKPFSGRFLLRIDPELHRSIAVAATRNGKSINHWIKEALQEAAEKTG